MAWSVFKHRYPEPEIWKSLVGFEGHYEVSSYGRLRGIERVCDHFAGIRKVPAKMISLFQHRSGYIISSLHGKTYRVHTLVCLTFNGRKPKGRFTVNHIKMIPSFNFYRNLEWMLLSDNISQAWRLKKRDVAFGDRCNMSKLTSKQIPAIRKMLSAGVPVKEVAGKYSVALCTIYRINKGQTWRRN